MSQYPYPQHPAQPNYYSNPPATGTHPALTRAALFLFIIGGLTALGGFCFSGLMALAPMEAMEQAMAQQQKTMSEPIPFDLNTIKTVFVVIFVAVAVMGVIHFALGFGVRKGNMPAIMAAVVLTTITLLFLLIFVLASLATIAINPVAGVFDVILTGVPAIAMVFQFICLLKARSVVAAGGSTAQLQQQQYQMQMWQHQQMQQAYAQQPGQPPVAGGPPAGYGYGYITGQPQQPQNPVPQQQVPPPSPPSNPAGGSDVPPRQE